MHVYVWIYYVYIYAYEVVELIFVGKSKCSYYRSLALLYVVALSTVFRFILKSALLGVQESMRSNPTACLFCHFPPAQIIPGSLPQLNPSGCLLSSEPEPLCLFPLPAMPFPLSLPC